MVKCWWTISSVTEWIVYASTVDECLTARTRPTGELVCYVGGVCVCVCVCVSVCWLWVRVKASWWRTFSSVAVTAAAALVMVVNCHWQTSTSRHHLQAYNSGLSITHRHSCHSQLQCSSIDCSCWINHTTFSPSVNAQLSVIGARRPLRLTHAASQSHLLCGHNYTESPATVALSSLLLHLLNAHWCICDCVGKHETSTHWQ